MGLNPETNHTQTLFGPELLNATLKDCVTADIEKALRFFDHPSATEVGTTRKKVHNAIQDLKLDVEELLAKLKPIAELTKGGTSVQNFSGYIMHILREDSARSLGISSGLIGPDWTHPIDPALFQAIEGLNKLLPYLESSLLKSKEQVSARGKSTTAKEQRDRLFFFLCGIYRHYSGKIPMAWEAISSADSGIKVYGAIIPFLQEILPLTNYGNSITDIALQTKLERLRKHEPYSALWQKQ